jgi:hypothetical protein
MVSRALILTPAGFSNYEWTPSYGIEINGVGDGASVYVKTDTSYILSAEKWPGCTIILIR